MVAPSILRTGALQGVRLTVVGDVFSTAIPQNTPEAADNTQNAMPFENFLATREEIEDLIRFHGGHIIADEVRGVLAVVGEVENQLERYNVKDDGALVISFTMLLDHLSAFYDGLVSHRTLLTPICARQEQAQNAAAQLRRFYVAGEVFNGPLTYPPGAEHDPSWGRLGLTPGEIYVLISGTLNFYPSHAAGPGVHIVYGHDVSSSKIAGFLNMGASCYDIDHIMRHIISTNASSSLARIFEQVSEYRRWKIEHGDVFPTLLNGRGFFVAAGTFAIPDALQAFIKVKVVHEQFVKRFIIELGGHVTRQAGTNDISLVGDGDSEVASSVMSRSGVTPWTLERFWDVVCAKSGAETAIDHVKTALIHIGTDFTTPDRMVEDDSSTRAVSPTGSPEELAPRVASSELPVDNGYDAKDREQSGGAEHRQSNDDAEFGEKVSDGDESRHAIDGQEQHGQNSSELEEVDDYVDTRGAEEVEFSNDEEEEEDAIQLVQSDKADGAGTEGIVKRFHALRARMDAFYDDLGLSEKWWTSMDPLPLLQHTRDVLDHVLGAEEFPISYNASVEDAEEWRRTERHVAGMLAELQIVRMLVMASSRGGSRPLLDSEVFEVATRACPAEHALAEIMTTPKISLKLLLVTSHRQSLEALNAVLAKMEPITTFKLEILRPGVYFYAQPLRRTIQLALGGQVVRGIYAGSATKCVARISMARAHELYSDPTYA